MCIRDSIHISQIADHRIEKPQDALKVGDIVKVKITDIDFDKHRVSLSIRALLEEQQEADDKAAAESTEDAVVYVSQELSLIHIFFRKGRPAESLGIVERGSGPCPAEPGIKVFCFPFFSKGRKERYG